VGDPLLELASYLICQCYIQLEPENIFIVVDATDRPDTPEINAEDRGEGEVVGYIVGTPDTMAFFRKYDETFIPFLKLKGIHEPSAISSTGPETENPKDAHIKGMKTALYTISSIGRDTSSPLATDIDALLRTYPGHLHISILPSRQRKGYGQELMSAFLAHIGSVQKQAGIGQGVQLLMAADNYDGERFYRKCGFERYGRVLDGGRSGELGRDDATANNGVGHIWLCRSLK
jgi:GNAT superfamily N-acetyltransferase